MQLSENETKSVEGDAIFGKLTAVIIGFGQSGARFARACAAIDPKIGSIRIIGIADCNPERLSEIPFSNVEKSVNFQSLWTKQSPDLVIVSTNDADHHRVLMDIRARTLSFRRILCEKPLVTNLDHGADIQNGFNQFDLSVNFLERFSPAVIQLRDYLRMNHLAVRRADFTWSKYRIKDPRPSSIGVLSEICHGLDLALFLSGIQAETPFELKGGYKITSDFTRDCVVVPDELSFSVSFPNNVIISGRSSYVRTGRSRRLELLLSNKGDTRVVEIAELVLDDPLWDDDRLFIYRPGDRGDLKVIWEFQADSGLLPKERRNIDKLCRFVEANVSEIHGATNAILARRDDALYVQQIAEYAAQQVQCTNFSGFPKRIPEFGAELNA